MLLCYTGASRFSGDTIGRVMRAYEQGEPAIAGALDGLRRVADDMAGALARRRPRPGRRAASARTGGCSRCWIPAMSTPEMAGSSARWCDAGCARRKGGGLRRRRVDVLPRARRSPCGARGRRPAGHAAAAGAVGPDGCAPVLSAAAAGDSAECGSRVGRPCGAGAASGLARCAACSAGRPSPPRSRHSSRGRRDLSRTTARRSSSIPGARGRIAARRASRSTPGAGTTAPWARWQHLWLAERAAELAAVAARGQPAGCGRRRRGDPLGLRLPLCGLSQPRQRARAQPAVLLDVPRIHLADQLPGRGAHAPRGRDARSAVEEGVNARRGRGGQSDRRVRRGVLQPADLAQRGARRLSRCGSRTRSWPAARSRDRPERSRTWCAASATTGCGTRARTTISSRFGVSSSRWAGPGRPASTSWRDPRLAARLEGALRAPALTALPDFTFPGAEGLAVRRVAGAADVSRAVGGRARAPRSRRLRPVGLAPRALRRAGAGGGRASIPTCTRPAPSRRRVREPGRISPGGPCSRWRRRWAAGAGRVAAGEHAAGEPGARDPPPRRSLRQSRVRRVRRRPRPSRPAASHAARERPALAARSRDRLVRRPRSLLVSLDARAQRAATRRRLPAAARRGVPSPSAKRATGPGRGARYDDFTRTARRGPALSARHPGDVRARGARGGAAVAPAR